MAATQRSGTTPVAPPVTTPAGHFLRTLATGGSTPSRLRVLMVVTAILAVLFAVLGAFGVGRRDAALSATTDAAQQLIDVQNVQVSLVRADALASENYLRGSEDPAKRAQYVQELQLVSTGLVAVGNRVLPADAALLAGVSASLGEYSGLVEQARANNRQGYPVGAAYLRNANALAADMVVVLREVQVSLRDQVNDNLDRADKAGAWLHLVGWPLLLVIIAGSAWMTARFRRVVNVPVAGGGLLLLVLLVFGGSSQAGSMSDAEAATRDPLQSADLVAQARSAAFDAHSQEFFTLINRGNAQSNEVNWDTARADADTALQRLCDRTDDCELGELFSVYAGRYEEMRALDNDEGDWDAAVALSLGDANAAFDAFAVSSQAAADEYTDRAVSALASSSDGLSTLRVFVFVGGLGIAVLALLGYGQRLREYR